MNTFSHETNYFATTPHKRKLSFDSFSNDTEAMSSSSDEESSCGLSSPMIPLSISCWSAAASPSKRRRSGFSTPGANPNTHNDNYTMPSPPVPTKSYGIQNMRGDLSSLALPTLSETKNSSFVLSPRTTLRKQQRVPPYLTMDDNSNSNSHSSLPSLRMRPSTLHGYRSEQSRMMAELTIPSPVVRPQHRGALAA
jgi:hypothetical protein